MSTDKKLDTIINRLESIEKTMATKSELKSVELTLKREIFKNREQIIRARDLLLEDIYKRLDRIETTIFHAS